MSSSLNRTIILGSRPSRLAQWQTGTILNRLKEAWPDLSFEVVNFVTEGDRVLERPLPEIGGKGLFTAELEEALRSGGIDLAVHSLKDLPVDLAPGLTIGAIGRRDDARDVLVSATGRRLSDLPAGSRVGTSSLRRTAQLKAFRPDLETVPLRGNVDTRLRKALDGQYDAIILAAAGVERLGLGHTITEYLPFDVMLPAPGQGALAVQCRADDEEILGLLQPVHDRGTAWAVTAERAFLATLDSGCSAPVAAYAQVKEPFLEISGLVSTVDGTRVIRVSLTGEDPVVTGELLAHKALAQGAWELLQ